MWNIKKIVSKGDYNYAVVPEHPVSNKYGYVLEHRIIMENYLGRLLDSNEIVHHIDDNKKNNDITNLELCLIGVHEKFHGRKKTSKMVNLKCPECGKHFVRRLGQTFLQKGSRFTCCSRSCAMKLSRYITIHGKTATVEHAISGNIVSFFTINDDNPEQTD